MLEQVNNLTWFDPKSTPDKEFVERYTKLGYIGEENLHRDAAKDWYMLLHRMQGTSCLLEILKGHLRHLSDDSGFLENSLICEWAYYVDFEEGELEVWRASRLFGVLSLGNWRRWI